jgi:hypothetical protein
MTDIPTEAIAGLETALRDAAARSMKPGMPVPLALGFFQAVVGLARCLRQFRKIAGLPPALSIELTTLLNTVWFSASGRLLDPNLTEAQALRLMRLIQGLSRAFLLSVPVPAKAKRAAPTPFAARPAAANLAPAAPSRRRPDQWENVGAIAVRALDTAAMRNPEIADAFQKATGRKLAA